MNQTALAYEQLIEKFVAWAQTQPNIRAAIVLGSRARIECPADEWSDLDLLMVVTDPQPYLTGTKWLKNIGNAWITFIEPTATGGEMERRVLFEGGLDVDFSIIPQSTVEQIIQRGVPPEVNETFRRGFRVLLDQDGLVAQMNLSPTARVPAKPPTQSGFDETINDFWYHAVLTAKKLRRGELWTANLCCDGYMKRLLLKAMEWHAQVLHGADYDTWHSGRFLEQWAESRTVDELRRTFAHYDAVDIGRALVATMVLFRRLTKEIADWLGYAYPTHADEAATELVAMLLTELLTEQTRTETDNGLYSGAFSEEAIYEITVKGRLDEHWSGWLDDLAITHDEYGNTHLVGAIPDQAALHGVLAQIRDLGLPLVALAGAEMNNVISGDSNE